MVVFRLFFNSSRKEPRCVAALRSTALSSFALLGTLSPDPEFAGDPEGAYKFINEILPKLFPGFAQRRDVTITENQSGSVEDRWIANG
jgi:hypothetical protein